jgi:hypothetical protein
LGEVIGDVSITTDGGANVAVVQGIRGRVVADITPVDGQIYQFNGTEWVPTNFTAGTY